MDIDAYLNRIQYKGDLPPTAQTLKDLQVAHLLTVPFENLSIHLNQPIDLDEGALFEKVVQRGRGGFCYELNGLFSALLRELGFEVVKLSAAVSRADNTYTPFFDHMTMMVTLEKRWLVEVGFGDTFREPLLIDTEKVQVQEGASYRIDEDEGVYTLMGCKDGGEWQPHYKFGLESYAFQDFGERCHFQQYSPESHFRKGRVCSRITPDGRITLSEIGLTRTWLDGRREEKALENEKEFPTMLAEHFDIQLGEPEWQLL
jgi:N-hydroxyarylamine O-acetyltransferase